MSGREEPAATARLAELSEDERRILAALAIVGRASLSPEELAQVLDVDDVRPLVDDLDRRGLIRHEEGRRYSLAGRVASDLRRVNDTLETADRLIGYVETLAHGGKLTPARLEQDAEAILGIVAWGAETERWETVVEVVKTVQAAFALAHRVAEQRVLLEAGRDAARHLGDRAAEAWMLERLTVAADRLGDATARTEYRDALRRLRGRSGRFRPSAGRALGALTLVAAAGAGTAAGLAIGRHTAHPATTVLTSVRAVTRTVASPPVTRNVTVTAAAPAQTTTVATTVVSVTTELVTTTVQPPTTASPKIP